MNILIQMGSIDDGFVFCPVNGYPRLIRYDLPDNDTGCIATIDEEFNLLHVNPSLYSQLTDTEKHVILKARRRIYMTDLRG